MKKVFIILSACLLALASRAQSMSSEALPFVQLDFNPASLAMGSTVVPGAAGIPLSGFTIAAGAAYENYMPQISATQYISGGAALKHGRMGAALSFARGTGEPVSGENFTPVEILLNGGISYGFTGNLAAGVNVKYAKEELLSDYSNGAVAVDAFVAGRFDNLDICAGVTSIGQQVSSERTGNFNLPSSVTAGCGYTLGFDRHSLCARAKADYFFSGAFAAGAGVEYGFNGLAFARAGYHYGGESVVPSFASAGIGLHISMLTLDAVYLFASDVLSGSFAVSAGVRF